MNEQGNFGRPQEATFSSEVLSQKEGLVRLYSFLVGKDEASVSVVSREDADLYLRDLILGANETPEESSDTPKRKPKDNITLSPFVLDISAKNPQKASKKPSYGFYLGQLNGASNFYLNFSIPEEQRGKINTLYVVPNYLDVGDKPYYWLDFYNQDKTKEDEKGELVTSCRLKPEEPVNKISFERWHGIGEQLLADYILGENNVSFENLVPFDIPVSAKSGLAMYRIGAREGLEIHLEENPLAKSGKTLRFIPKKDEQGMYEWMEIDLVDDQVPQTKWQQVASYRLNPLEHRMSTQGWFGPEKQLLIDYLQGNISFENLMPIRTKITTKGDYVDLIVSKRIHNKMVSFYFPKDSFAIGDEVVFMPRQDQKKYYQWLEVYRTDPDSGDAIGKAVSSGRLLDGKFIQKGWNGYEIELLKEFAGGNKSYEDLVPLNLQRGENPMINLWKEGAQKIYFVPSLLFGVAKGDDLLLIPEEQEGENVNFLLKRGELVLGRYRFYRQEKVFKLTGVIHQAQEGFFDEKMGRYTDSEGRSWMSAFRLAVEYRMNPNLVYRLLENLEGMPYSFQRKMTLYREEEARVAIEIYRVKERHAGVETTSQAVDIDANKYLRDLVFGGDET